MLATSRNVSASRERYPAYPSWRPTAQYLMTGSRFLESAATAADFKCSTFFPSYGDGLAVRECGWVGGTNAHGLADEPELLLDGLPRSNLAGGGICAEEVPGVESGEVLQRAEDLVTTGGRGNELEVVGHRGVVYKAVGDHDENVESAIGMRILCRCLRKVRSLRFCCRVLTLLVILGLLSWLSLLVGTEVYHRN